MYDLTLAATKKVLADAHKAFARNPSAINWNALQHAMYDHQAAHQLDRSARAHAKVIAQSAELDCK